MKGLNAEQFYKNKSLSKDFGFPDPLKQEGEKKMNIKDEAKAYVPMETLNISDLDKIPVDMEIFEKTAITTDGKEFSYKYLMANDKEYRIPYIVLGQLKQILEKKPDLKMFSVSKTGEGLKTKYMVIPE